MLARWAAMVAINLQCRAKLLMAFPIERLTIMDGKLPDGWQISVGAMYDNKLGGDSFTRGVALPIQLEEDVAIPMVSCLFVVEKICFHVLSTIAAPLLEMGIMFTSGMSDGVPGFRQLWRRNTTSDAPPDTYWDGKSLVQLQNLMTGKW
ncbi:hypothetical protein [Asticcacaulis solisilvae]|uniref:hypothetical protein n=1 Tax=Asticcacaulis solisilvae TaxID=1217274 RepID=UPI003FD861A2